MFAGDSQALHNKRHFFKCDRYKSVYCIYLNSTCFFSELRKILELDLVPCVDKWINGNLAQILYYKLYINAISIEGNKLIDYHLTFKTQVSLRSVVLAFINLYVYFIQQSLKKHVFPLCHVFNLIENYMHDNDRIPI